MTTYFDVVSAATETAGKILALRGAGAYRLAVQMDGGDTARVNWSPRAHNATIHLPSLPADAVLTRAEADRLVGYIVHECCHVLHSSRDGWDAAVAAGSRVQRWTNALEDVRIEAKEIRAGAFPAMRSVLSGLLDKLHYDSTLAARAAGFRLGDRVADAPYVACVLGRLANKYDVPSARTLAADMAPNVRKLVDHALANIRACRNTDQVRQLAHVLVQMENTLPPDAPQQPQPPRKPQPPQGEPQGAQGEPQGAQGEPQDTEEDDGAHGEPQDADQNDDTQGEPQDADQGNGAQGEPQDADQGNGAQDAPPTDTGYKLADVVEKIAERAGVDIADVRQPQGRAHELAQARSWAEPVNKAAWSPGEHAASAQALDQRLPGNSVLHGQIARLLVTEEIHRRTHHEMSGRLDRRALVRMRTGAPDVYSQRDDTPGIDTALLILVDGSGSMDQGQYTSCSRMAMAQVAAWHVAKAAEMAGGKVAIVKFVTPSVNAARHPAALLRVIKPWEVPTTQCAAAVAAMNSEAYTPLSPAILGAADMLAAQSASRRILLVMTDGQCDMGGAAVTAACNLAAAQGVEVVGLGMDCEEVTEAFPPRYSHNVTSLDQLAGTGMGTLVDMLEAANQRGAD